MDHVIAYGRVNPSPGLEPIGRRFQRQVIRSQVRAGFPVQFVSDAVPGDAPFSDRPMLQLQLFQAAAAKQNLAVEAMDKLIATYDRKVVAGIRVEVNRFGVKVAVANINQHILGRIKKVLVKSNPRKQKRRKLVPLVEAHLKWRESTIYRVGNGEPATTTLGTYDLLQENPLYPVLRECSDHLVRLKPDAPDFDWCVHSFLGAAWEHRTRLLLEVVASPTSHLGYGQRPNDLDMFAVIRWMEQEELTTWDNRPKSRSNASIAGRLNEMGFTNLRGGLFSRKTVWQVRRSPAYLGSLSADVTSGPSPAP